ncbi:sorting nexin-13 [Tribolium castaneum]|uniref:Sorting nexin-13-like Protein n=1 Tax=Tribolium castaneum TaxID=7070 RepID=D6WN32_TRICA|nr:PREDICTED: sorting nexin-13 [Tribolium castaneum]XP_008194284.1 PREDICTED: sorting nexin-13 [Tribolium castaneum]EFA04766.2 Sorting nexin-13-like Protein [Tribolium castaneum]|eukprot:XP_001812575.1 PREDICTED: sorting nexin-13 [Tribolium castaneum]
MDINALGWMGLIITLFLTSFGLFSFLTTALGLLTFILGFITLVYLRKGDIDKFHNHCAGNPLTVNILPEGGLRQVVRQLVSPQKVQKTDSRVTGSELIDNSLQEILGYIVRDYISPWYNLISRDTEFTDITIRKTAQTFAINISNRVKEIDWIPYLTTRLVDDAATHLRLFKQARARMKFLEKSKTPKQSPLKDQKNSPRKTHKRNKSETDVGWYHGKANDIKKEPEVNVGNSKFYLNDSKKSTTLEDHFFDLECQMENYLVCRDVVSMDVAKEKEFLCEIIEILLYILLPDEDFHCKPLRYVLREIFANCVIQPLFAMLSDPDYINQAIIWLCLRDGTLPSDIFLTTLRITDNCDELKSTKNLAEKEVQQLRSRDSGGDSDLAIKQQLSSLSYVLKLIESRLIKMQDAENLDTPTSLDYVQLESIKKIDLKLHQILKNNVALSYFIDYVSSQKKHLDLFFYLTIEGWKVSVEQQLSDLHINKIKGASDNSSAVFEEIRSTALSIYNQYLGEKSDQRVVIKPALTQSLFFKIRNLNEIPSELWFDEVQQAIYDKMENDDEYLPAFKRSKAYFKLLQELDLVQQNVTEEDAISLNSNESIELINTESKSEQSTPQQHANNLFLVPESTGKNVKHARSFSDVTMFMSKNNSEVRANGNDFAKFETEEVLTVEDQRVLEKSLKTGEFVLNVNIIETGIVCEKGKMFGIYAIRVSRQYETGFLEEWHIYRRYSDFYDLYSKVKDKFPDLSKLSFPGKKTFHNMDRAVLERRMKMLGSYMSELCNPSVLTTHSGLQDLLMMFLEQGDYDKATGGPISSTINTLVNPLKSGMKTIKNMPEQLFNTVDEVMGGITKVFHAKPGRLPEASKVGASIEETDDNIPLRIMLLLMDEVFDLKSRNQWLRRRIVTLLRQIVRTMFGDIVNRRILDYVSFITSPKNVAHYLYVFKQSFWPNGMKYEKKADRDEDTRNRTRVAAKVALLSCLSDELKHIIGSETTRRGLLTIFELFQRPILNRRLFYVLLEGVLCTLFPEKDMFKLFQKLHSKSKRIQDKHNTQTVR